AGGAPRPRRRAAAAQGREGPDRVDRSLLDDLDAARDPGLREAIGVGSSDAMSEDASPAAPADSVEVSIVMPCLNEADTLETCLTKARRALDAAGIPGEIIVADNGSTDGSREIAARSGARLVPVAARGYGNALMGGIAAARGRYVIMGDADDSYDFLETPRF